MIELEEPLRRRVAECGERSAGRRVLEQLRELGELRERPPKRGPRRPERECAHERIGVGFDEVQTPVQARRCVTDSKAAPGLRSAMRLGRPNRATPPTTTSEMSRSLAVSR